MTFLEFCEKLNGKPLNKWQKDYIETFEEMREKGIPLYALKRGSTKHDTILWMKLLHNVYEKEILNEQKQNT